MTDQPAVPSSLAADPFAASPFSLAIQLMDLLSQPADGLPAALAARLRTSLPSGCVLLPLEQVSPSELAGMRLTPLQLQSESWREWVLLTPAAMTGIEELASSLTAVLAGFWRLRAEREELFQQAMSDELTGLANARRFRLFLDQTLDWSHRTGWPVTLLLFDIDNFKQYNELYGHLAGDRILRQIAALLKKSSRADDLVARLSGGGDEFAVVCWDKHGPRRPRQPQDGVQTVASPLQFFERFKKRLESEEFPDLGPTRLGQLTISAGMAVCPLDASDADTLIARADEALMGHAKRLGKNRLHIVGQAESPSKP